jgi:hypothetical protein
VISPYELSAEQVAEMKEWLSSWDPCPWCDAERPWSPGMAHVDQPITHRADCLLALVTEETRDG